MRLKQEKKDKKKKRKKEKEKKKARKNTLKQKLLGLIFYRSPQSNLLQFNKMVISNLKLKEFGPKKVTIK